MNTTPKLSFARWMVGLLQAACVALSVATLAPTRGIEWYWTVGSIATLLGPILLSLRLSIGWVMFALASAARVAYVLLDAGLPPPAPGSFWLALLASPFVFRLAISLYGFAVRGRPEPEDLAFVRMIATGLFISLGFAVVFVLVRLYLQATLAHGDRAHEPSLARILGAAFVTGLDLAGYVLIARRQTAGWFFLVAASLLLLPNELGSAPALMVVGRALFPFLNAAQWMLGRDRKR